MDTGFCNGIVIITSNNLSGMGIWFTAECLQCKNFELLYENANNQRTSMT